MRTTPMQTTPTRRTPRWRPVTAAAAVMALALTGAACSSDDSEGSGPSTGADQEATTGTGSAEETGEVPVSLVRLDVDLDEPIAAVSAPGGESLLVAERTGTVVEVLLDDEGNATGVEPVLDVSDQVGSITSEQGLLDLAVDPDGRQLYLSYTRGSDGASQLVSYDLPEGSGTAAAEVDTSTRRLLLEQEQPFPNHNGGRIVFGPDGMLYMALGDGGGGGDPEGHAQDRSSLLGKILRLDPSVEDSVPADNPFVDGTDDERGEIWLTGVRNPWRFSFDRATGDLWVADVGQDRIEEVSVLRAADGSGRGANLGWDLFEGDDAFDDADPAPGAASEGPFTEPVFTYTHEEGGCSITGGVVYRGDALAELSGAYLFSDFCTPGLRALRVAEDGTVSVAPLGVEATSVVSFAEGPSGEVYVVSLDDGLFRLEPA